MRGWFKSLFSASALLKTEPSLVLSIFAFLARLDLTVSLALFAAEVASNPHSFLSVYEEAEPKLAKAGYKCETECLGRCCRIDFDSNQRP